MSWIITRDGKIKAHARTQNEAFMKLQKLQPFSVFHATNYEGWKISPAYRKKNIKEVV